MRHYRAIPPETFMVEVAGERVFAAKNVQAATVTGIAASIWLPATVRFKLVATWGSVELTCPANCIAAQGGMQVWPEARLVSIEHHPEAPHLTADEEDGTPD